MTEKNTSENTVITVSEKAVKTHMLVIAAVCLVFGIVNIAAGAALLGIITAATGIIVPAAVILLKNKLGTAARGRILSMAQLLVIIIISSAKHELHGMYPLMLASITIAGKMDDAIRISEESAKQSEEIKRLAENQTVSAEAVKQKMDQITEVISQLSRTSEKSADTARSVTDGVNKMNAIVRKFN